MAVDTAEKRFSMLNFGDGTTIHLLFEPDDSVDLDDRQHLLDSYSGIAFAAPVLVVLRPARKFTVRPGVVTLRVRGRSAGHKVSDGTTKLIPR